jgi:hypothetical protein
MTKKVKKASRVPDARESNAGDDFHILWAAIKSLDMINSDGSGLKLVTIEGPTNEESRVVDPTGGLLLGIDMTEYYGGNIYSEADKVVFSQLKYSTVRSDVAWTVAKLCQGKKSGSVGSVIERLSDVFKSYSKYSRNSVVKKVRIKLVSNRSISADLTELVKIQQHLCNDLKIQSLPTLKSKYRSAATNLGKLFKASKLTTANFCDFLRVLDFSDCGADSRFALDQKLIRTISKAGTWDAESQRDKLCQAIHRKMMPENVRYSSLNEQDILMIFGASDYQDIFPAPSKLETGQHIIERTQIKDIANSIIQSAGKIVCIHGAAGIGKSTISTCISKYMPSGSHTQIFDCYGGGRYLDPTEYRHTHKNACLQISNELAKQFKTSFLLLTNVSSEHYITELKRRIVSASEVVKSISESALLVMVIDAADNSITAANEKHDKSFVSDLLALDNLPENCRIVITGRTGRIESLDLPVNTLKIELKPFTNEETLAFLQGRWKTTSIDQAIEICGLTNGIPRVLRYAMQNRDSVDGVLTLLRPFGKAVNTIFEELIKEAQQRQGSKSEVKKFFEVLILLPRPVPISYVAEFSGLKANLIEDYCIDLWHGLVSDKKTISFRDEDFETYIREHYTTDATEYEKISGLFWEKAKVDPYASIYLGEVLFKAGKHKELIQITLNAEYLDIIHDQIKKKETFIQRARRALQVSISTEDKNLFFKLLIVAAEASKTDEALSSLLVNNADLATIHGDPLTVQKLFFEFGNQRWGGVSNLKCAAVLSRSQPNLPLAKKHLERAESWLRWRNEQSEDERREMRIDERAVAAGAEATLRIYGLNKASQWLDSCRPEEFGFDSARLFVRNVASYLNDIEVKQWFSSSGVGLSLLLVCELHRLNVVLSEDSLKQSGIVKRLKKIISQRTSIPTAYYEPLVYLCELLFSQRYDSGTILSFLESIKIEVPQHQPRFFTNWDRDDEKLDIYFRVRVLQASLLSNTLSVADLLPVHLSKPSEEGKKESSYGREEKSQFETAYKYLLAVYNWRIEVLAKGKSLHIYKDFASLIDTVQKDFHFEYQRHDVKEFYLFVLNKALDLFRFEEDQPSVLETLKACFFRAKTNKIEILIALANRASRESALKLQALNLLAEIRKNISTTPRGAEEKMAYWIRCARIGNFIDLETGADYFSEAVKSASDIDYDAVEQIKGISNLLQFDSLPASKLNEPRISYEFSRFVEYCHERLRGYDHFPWDDAIQGLASLDFGTSLSVLCRWDHRSLIEMERYSHIIVESGLDNSRFSPEQMIGSIGLFDHFYTGRTIIVKKIAQSLLNIGRKDLLTLFIQRISRDVKLLCPVKDRAFYVGELMKIIEELKLDKTLCHELIVCSEFLNSLYKSKSKENSDYSPSFSTSHKNDFSIDIDALVKRTDVRNIDAVGQVVMELMNNEQLKYENQHYTNLFLRKLREQCSVNEYVPFLNVIPNLDDSCHFHIYQDILKQSLSEWNVYPPVKAWQDESFDKIILKILTEENRITNYLHLSDFQEAAKIFNKDSFSLAQSIQSAFVERIEDLSAQEIYQSFVLLRPLLSTNDRVDLIDWALKRWNAPIEEQISEGSWKEQLLVSQDDSICLASYIRYGLGHPDKRTRWNHAHVVRDMVNAGDEYLLRGLLETRDEPTNSSFQFGGHKFFAMSAKLWLFAAIERLSYEDSTSIRKYSQIFFEESMNKKGHLLIRTFAKNCCLNLAQKFPELYQKQNKDQLNLAMTPRVDTKNVEEVSDRLMQNRSHEDLNTRFDFDPMDTLPYWYDSVGDQFGISSVEVAKIADAFICENLGYKEDEEEKDHVEAKWEETQNRHGSNPTVEALRKYYEFHGMFYAANELLETRPIVIDHYTSWAEWLNGWLLVRKGNWLADYRDSAPLERRFWRLMENGIEKQEWRWSLTIDEFDKIVGLNPTSEYIRVLENSESFHGDDKEDVQISSALVSIDKASSLLRAIQTDPDEYGIYLPHEKEKEEEVNDLGFTLRGWIMVNDIHNEGLDSVDPQANKLFRIDVRPGKLFQKWAKGKLVNREKQYETKGINPVVLTRLENWSDDDDRKRYYDSQGSKGYRLHARVENLLQFLSHVNLALIVKCTIKRRGEYKREEDYPSSKKVYIIHPNGTIETLFGSYTIR